LHHNVAQSSQKPGFACCINGECKGCHIEGGYELRPRGRFILLPSTDLGAEGGPLSVGIAAE